MIVIMIVIGKRNCLSQSSLRSPRDELEIFNIAASRLDACGNRMELRSNRKILKKNPVREAILFRQCRIKRSVVNFHS